MIFPCVIELLGGLRVRRVDHVVTRFRTQRTGTLLAYIAYYLRRQHAREELIDLFWPEADIDCGSMSLRTSLSSLRRQLEPPGAARGSILVTDRNYVTLNSAAVSTDVLAMESATSAAERADDMGERACWLEQAVALYRGPLLPGVYDDWAVQERERMQMRHQDILLRLVDTLEQMGECRRALEFAHRAVALDPLAEETHRAIMRLYAATGQVSALARHYRELGSLLRRELKAVPSTATQELYARLTSEPRSNAGSRLTGRADAVVSPPTVSAPVEAKAGTARPGAGADTAELVTDRESPSQTAGLPIYLTPFFGREQEKARIIEWLRDEGARLVTVSGPGGSGKTRLALEAARLLAAHLDGAVWFVPLADIVDPALIIDRIVRALALPPSPAGSSLAVINHALTRRRSLLLLDNFDQLAQAGARVLCELLALNPMLSCLVTSRERLELGGVRDCPLSPLPVPEMPDAPDRLMQYASVQLFVHGAQAVRPDFQLTVGNAPAVSALCERLEGIPLAIELAAAWARVLTPGRMLARLSESNDLLATTRRDVEPRHRTLRATFEWSYRLLPTELQCLLAWLSVFRGGWTLEAAERVCTESTAADQDAPRSDILAQMRSLQARSLVLAEEAGEEMRFRMLETLREFAAQQLAPEDRRAIEERHASYFLRFAEQADAAMDGADQAAWMARLDRDIDNFRAALERALGKQDVENGLRLATALARYWQASGGGDEGLRWLESLLAKGAPVTPRLQARALYELDGLLRCRRMDRNVLDVLEESLRIYTELDDGKAMAAVLRKMGTAVLETRHDHRAAVELLERSLALCRLAGDVRGLAETLRSLGSAVRDHGEYAAAESYYEESLARFRQLADIHGVAAILAEMGYMLQEQQQFDRAEALLQESLDLSRSLGNKLSIGHTLWLLGRLDQERGRFDEAARRFEEGLALARQTGNRQQTVNCLVNMGILSSQQGDYHEARRRYADAIAIIREIGNRIGLALPLRLDGNSALECGDTGAARERFRECLSILRGCHAPHPVIDCLEGLAQVYQAEGKAEYAARMYGAAQAARQAVPGLVESGAPPVHARMLDGLRGSLGNARFQQMWNEGLALSPTQAVEAALLPE